CPPRFSIFFLAPLRAPPHLHSVPTRRSSDLFHDTHRLVLEWIERGVLDGLRIDHPDGLRDPQEYFDRLRAAAPDAWIVAEKILEDRKSTRLNSSHVKISYAVFCLKKKKPPTT